jgi:hypothetical protein
MGWKCYVASCYKGAPTGSLLKAVCYVEYASYPPGLLADPVIKAHNGRHRGARRSSEEGCECLNYPVTLANLSSRQNAANMVSGHREAIRMSLLDPTHILCFYGSMERLIGSAKCFLTYAQCITSGTPGLGTCRLERLR